LLSNIKLCLFIANSISVSPIFPISHFIFADKACYFRWQPNILKLNYLPYDKVNFEPALGTLVEVGFIQKYEVGGQSYGVIPTFLKHQRINLREPISEIPAPEDAMHVHARAPHVQDNATHVQAHEEREKGREGKGREGTGKQRI
jgi:hypothetical protein